MKIKCDWCGSWINDFEEVCPNCMGVNHHYKRQSDGVPRTIGELQAWAEEKKLPLSDMRTYIGEDYRGAKAFGIYEDEDGTFVVYKNKADGTRVIRYHGADEAYAVNELYQKMKERVAQQKAHRASSGRKTLLHSILLIYFVMLGSIIFSCIMEAVWIHTYEKRPSNGYYSYDDNDYYYYRGDWYEWQEETWTQVPTTDVWMEEDYSSYFDSFSYHDNYDCDNFADSEYYVEENSSYNDDDNSWESDWDSDDGWDSDDSWDSNDSWDSSWDDWDSDW